MESSATGRVAGINRVIFYLVQVAIQLVDHLFNAGNSKRSELGLRRLVYSTQTHSSLANSGYSGVIKLRQWRSGIEDILYASTLARRHRLNFPHHSLCHARQVTRSAVKDFTDYFLRGTLTPRMKNLSNRCSKAVVGWNTRGLRRGMVTPLDAFNIPSFFFSSPRREVSGILKTAQLGFRRHDSSIYFERSGRDWLGPIQPPSQNEFDTFCIEDSAGTSPIFSLWKFFGSIRPRWLIFLTKEYDKAHVRPSSVVHGLTLLVSRWGRKHMLLNFGSHLGFAGLVTPKIECRKLPILCTCSWLKSLVEICFFDIAAPLN